MTPGPTPPYLLHPDARHTWVASGKTRLHVAGVTPENATRGLFLVPGYTDHLGRYTDLFSYFVERGVAVWAMDPRGHGLSSGRRGFIHRFSDYLDDMQQGLASAHNLSEIHQWTLLGHSTGGLVALSAAIRRRRFLANWGVERLVVSSPLLEIGLPVTVVKRRLGRLASTVLPWLSLPSGGESYANSHDPDAEHRRRTDPLIFKWVNARWYTEVQAEMAVVRRLPMRVDVPVLGLQAGADRVVSPAATQAWCQACPAADYREYPDLFHEILLETERFQVFSEMADWLQGDRFRRDKP